MSGNPVEIEYKYLIRYPDAGLLESQPGCSRVGIRQTYLLTDPHVTERVRSWDENGTVRYFHTEKRRISDQSAQELEEEISCERYEELLRKADPERSVIEKVRYRIPYKGNMLEIDVYPFWSRQAVLEIEIGEENEEARIPSWLTVLRDVTSEKAYRNKALAKRIPEEDEQTEEASRM